MPSKGEWLNACRDRDDATLYALALADGRSCLRTFRDLDHARKLDLIHDVLASGWNAILTAENPRAWFITALTHRTIGWVRRRGAAVVEASGLEPSPLSEDPAYLIDAWRAFEALSIREQHILLADALGEPRAEIARAFGTTRANIDQIISRSRKRLEKDLK